MEEYERLSAKGSRACLAMALPSKITKSWKNLNLNLKSSDYISGPTRVRPAAWILHMWASSSQVSLPASVETLATNACSGAACLFIRVCFGPPFIHERTLKASDYISNFFII